MSAIILPTPHSSKALLPTHLYKNDGKLIGIDALSKTEISSLCEQLPHKTSVASVCFNGTIWEKIDAVASAGFDSIEIMAPDLDEGSPQEIFDYCRSRNLTISILQPFRDLEGYADPAKFEERLDEFEQMLEICQILKTDTILLCANCDSAAVDDLDLIVAQLRRSAQLAAKYHIKIAYENLSWATHNYEFGKLVDVILRVDEPNFGVCVDLFHINIHGSSIEPIDLLPGKVFFVQLCDSPNLSKDIDIIEHARNYRVFPFQGDYNNIMETYEKVRNSGYKGCLSLEVFNKLFKEKPGQCEMVADDALRSLVYLQALFSDIHDGTHFLPNVNVSAVSGPPNAHDSTELVFGFDSENDISNFHIRARGLGYARYCSLIRTIVKTAPSHVYVDVPSRLIYNRYTMLLKTVFNLQTLSSHPDTKTNEFLLPLLTAFGNHDRLVVITLRIMAE